MCILIFPLHQRDGREGAARCAALIVRLFALLPDKGGVLFCEREHPLCIPQRKACIAGFGLEGLHALRSVGAVYVASPRAPASRYRHQPRPTPWGASDAYSAADCGGGRRHCCARRRWGDGTDSKKRLRGDCGIASLAARGLLLFSVFRCDIDFFGLLLGGD